MTLFFDAVDIANIPSSATHAALYADGSYAASPVLARHRFPFRRWITVTGELPHCGIADYEPGNAAHDVAGRLRDYALERISHGYSKPVIYSDMNDLESAERQLKDIQHVNWVATRGHPKLTAEALQGLIHATTSLLIPVHQLWAQQYDDIGGQYDVSTLYGNWWE